MAAYNVLLVTVDSLRRDFLGAYSEKPHSLGYRVSTPNLDRFAERAAVFENHYAGSLPCMPARREFTCGVREFPWRDWGPVEPFDETVPGLASTAGATTALLTDHYHYLEGDGRGYFEAYDGVEFVRGHEYDPWKTAPADPGSGLRSQVNRGDDPEIHPGADRDQYVRNVAALDELDEREFFAPRVFSRAADWLRENSGLKQWFCYVDSFDVHEPFHCPEPYASLYTDEDPTDPALPLWPEYTPAAEQGMGERELEFVRSQFAGKVTMVDRWFGRLLDALDRTGAWQDTVVVVTTDHGYMLGEHGYLAKNYMPVYDEIAHTPLLVWHPDSPRTGERVDALTSAVDVYPTLLDGLGVDAPDWTHGRSLRPLVAGARDEHREYALYGYFGGDVNVTDGRYTYFHPTDDEAPRQHSTMRYLDPAGDVEAGDFLPYVDEQVWRYPAPGRSQSDVPTLYDTDADPRQTENVADERPAVTRRMREALHDRLDAIDAPERLRSRLVG
jgi:arylsulfatase A-like enzyme